MKNYDVVLKGFVCEWNAETENEVLITVAVCSAVMCNQRGVTWNFPNPPLVPLTITSAKPLSEKEKQALSSLGTTVELAITGNEDACSARLVSVSEHAERSLEKFIGSLYNVS